MEINNAIENLIQANDERKMSYVLEIEKLKARIEELNIIRDNIIRLKEIDKTNSWNWTIIVGVIIIKIIHR